MDCLLLNFYSEYKLYNSRSLSHNPTKALKFLILNIICLTIETRDLFPAQCPYYLNLFGFPQASEFWNNGNVWWGVHQQTLKTISRKKNSEENAITLIASSGLFTNFLWRFCNNFCCTFRKKTPQIMLHTINRTFIWTARLTPCAGLRARFFLDPQRKQWLHVA